MAEKIKKELALTPKMIAIIGFMRAEGAENAYFASDIADGTGLSAKSVSPVLTGMFNRGLVVKADASKEVVGKAGPEVRIYKTYTLTDLGCEISLEPVVA